MSSGVVLLSQMVVMCAGSARGADVTWPWAADPGPSPGACVQLCCAVLCVLVLFCSLFPAQVANFAGCRLTRYSSTCALWGCAAVCRCTPCAGACAAIAWAARSCAARIQLYCACFSHRCRCRSVACGWCERKTPEQVLPVAVCCSRSSGASGAAPGLRTRCGCRAGCSVGVA